MNLKEFAEMSVKKAKRPRNDENGSTPEAKKVKFEKPIDEEIQDTEQSPDKKKSKKTKESLPKKKKLSEKIEKKTQALKEKIVNKKSGGKKEKEELDPEKKAELKEKKKKLREDRRKKDKEEGVFDIGVRAKQVWEEVRREDCPESKKSKLLNELLELVKGNVSKIIYAHDTVRVIECLVALGDESIRDALFDEMKDDLMNIAKSKYATFFVQKMVKYGNKSQRDAIFKALEGRVAELTKHKIANNLVEACYNDYCNAAQRNRFLQEFFGPEFRHFKEDDARTVVQLMLRHPEKRRDVLKHLANNVTPLITKGCYNHSLVHTVLYNYMIGLNHQLEAVPAEKERRSKERSEFIATLREVCVHIVHSHDGARLAMNAIWHGSAKDRKAIIKSFKSYMTKTAKEEHGHMVLLAILDAVDDTKLTGKAVLSELISSEETIEEMLDDKYARKVLIYALVGRNKTHFHPDVLTNLGQGDGNANSKKEPEIRRKEVADSIQDSLCNFAAKKLNSILTSSPMTLFLGALIQSTESENANVGKLLEKLAKKIAQPFVPGDGTNLIESPAVHMFTKKILGKGDFYKLLLDEFDPETLNNCISCNRGAFLLVAITELENSKEGLKSVKKTLKNHMNFLKNQDNKGSNILLQKLSE